ncbi:MAG: phage/plasmid replication protein [Prevotella sp.]|nr:phage/plasmid replication protein [Prevotella sp.]
MIDKINLSLPRCRDMPDISGYLDNGNESSNVKTGEVSVFGNVENIKVMQYFGGYSIQGSLPKFLYGNNVCQLTRKEVGQAIEKLSDRLHLPLNDARVTSIEVGANICLTKQHTAYTRLLGDMTRMQRVSMADSLYYQGSGKVHPRQYYFYDKVAEVRKSGGTMPQGLEAANMMRYEMRLNGRLPFQLSIPEFKGSTLQDRKVYQELINRWLNGYLSINKLVNMEDEHLKKGMSVKEAQEVFIAQQIAKGGSSMIDEFIAKLKQNECFDNRLYYNRVKSNLQKLASKTKLSVDNGDIEELTAKVKQIAQDS